MAQSKERSLSVIEILKDLTKQIKKGGRVSRTSHRIVIDFAPKFSKALSEAGFLTIHFRSPLIDEGRYTEFIPNRATEIATATALKNILRLAHKDMNAAKVQAFHQHFLHVYFGLIGRSDSFSDVALRALAASGDSSQSYSFRFEDKVPHLLQYKRQSGGIGIKVDKSLKHRLMGWVGKDIKQSKLGELRLLAILYRVVWKSIQYTRKYNLKPWSHENLRICYDELSAQCFFASREAFLASEAARLIRNESAMKSVLEVFGKLFPEDSKASTDTALTEHEQQLRKMERILAMVQAAALYAPLSGDGFTLIGAKTNQDYPFASGLTVGSPAAQDDNLRDTVIAVFNELKLYCESHANTDQNSNQLSALKWEKTNDQMISQLGQQLKDEGIAPDVMFCMAYIADGLLGQRHENERISFRLAAGTDEALRQGFTPLFGKTGLSGETQDKTQGEAQRDFFRIGFPPPGTDPDSRRLKNHLNRLISVIEGNYSFSQDESLYLCFAYAEQKLEIRYLAQLSPRIQRSKYASPRRTFSQLEEIQSLSKLIRPVILAHLNKDDTGYIAFNERVWANGSKNRTPRWRAQAKEEWVRDALKDERSNLFDFTQRQGVPDEFYNDLCDVIQLIADAPGKGATFVLGKWEGELKTKGVKMTPVFDMVTGWKINEVTKEVLYQVAIQDGATVIASDQDKQRIYGRIQLAAIDEHGHPFDPYTWCPPEKERELIKLWDLPDSGYQWEEWGKWFKWGTRHKTAAGLAYIGKGAYRVVCISSDGDIHYFDGTQVIHLDNKPAIFVAHQ